MWPTPLADNRHKRFLLAGCLGGVLFVALLPWWRNHGYLRDLYDYGLVIAANGRLQAGERPYVDFITPIQAGFLGLNWLIERVGGGTYTALTWGGAGLIVAMGITLTLMLARRWAWWAAGVVGMVVTVSAASQHTILWHNALGVFCLALAAWASACAPVWRRETGAWHGWLAVGLFLGGLNKLNFQLVGVAVALAWAVRAGLIREATWRRVAVTVLGIGVVGLVLPVAAEVAWTGASFSLWWQNVVGLAGGSRWEVIQQQLTLRSLFQPFHNYYGAVLLPQVGLVGVALFAAVVVGCWPADPARRVDRFLLPLGAILGAVAAFGLLATNYEIICLAGGACLVLAVSLWLGFAQGRKPWVFVGGLLLPALTLGGSAWWSAWQGQRSQFGYAPAPRIAYLPAASAGDMFANLQGLRLPPNIVESMSVLSLSLPEPDAEGRRPVFFGLGMEWAERYFPGPRKAGKPLWVHWGTSYGPPAVEALRRDLLREKDGYTMVLTTYARDEWPDELRQLLTTRYAADHVGPAVKRWTRREQKVNLNDSFDTLAKLGGNVVGQIFHTDAFPLKFRPAIDRRIVMGTTQADGSLLLLAPVYQLRGVAVLERLPLAGNGPLSVAFRAVVHGATPENARWSQRIELPAGEDILRVPFAIDGQGKNLLFWISLPPESRGQLFAGLRELEITHGVESTGAEPALRPERLAMVNPAPELAESFWGEIKWRPQQFVVRGGRPAARGLELTAGGEAWLHTEGMTGEVRGQIALEMSQGNAPTVHIVWYKGGRLQILQSGQVARDRPFDFHVWTAEPGGWIGVLVEADEGLAPAVVRVTSSTLTP